MKKILLIVGTHPNERYTKKVVEKSLDFVKDFEVTVKEWPTESFENREVNFNLNRLNDLEKLQQLSDFYSELKALSDYDLVLDVHNSPDIQNCLIITNMDSDYKIHGSEEHLEYVQENIITRRSDFSPISEILRKNGLTAYTLEINSMNREYVNMKDVFFLVDAVKTMSDMVLTKETFVNNMLPLVHHDSNELKEFTVHGDIEIYAGDLIELPSDIVEGYENNARMVIHCIGYGKENGKTLIEGVLKIFKENE